MVRPSLTLVPPQLWVPRGHGSPSDLGSPPTMGLPLWPWVPPLTVGSTPTVGPLLTLGLPSTGGPPSAASSLSQTRALVMNDLALCPLLAYVTPSLCLMLILFQWEKESRACSSLSLFYKQPAPVGFPVLGRTRCRLLCAGSRQPDPLSHFHLAPEGTGHF